MSRGAKKNEHGIGGGALSFPMLLTHIGIGFAGGVMILTGLILAGIPLPFRRRRSEREDGGLRVSVFRSFSHKSVTPVESVLNHAKVSPLMHAN